MQTGIKNICVVGLGYIGLPTASLLATKGYKVTGVDVKAEVVDTINRGEIHITEADLDVLVRSAVNSGELTASLEPIPADVFIIAVPTPFKADHVPDVSYVEAAVNTIAPSIQPGNLIILESTSPIGTTEKIAEWLQELRPDLNIPKLDQTNHIDEKSIYIAHCPERVLPGQIIRELVDNDRIIGGINQASRDKAKQFYETFVSGEILITNSRTAEMAKLVENAFRDVNIAFANELSMICDALEINVWELIELANHHPRVNILQPGAGVGGHCIAVDPWFIIDAIPEQAKLIKTARQINDAKPQFIINKVKQHADRFKTPIVACLGLAYKPNIDDLRESPAVEIVNTLAAEQQITILAVEPNIEVLPDKLSQANIELTELHNAIQAADIVVLLVDHEEFYEIQAEQLSEKVLIDSKGIWQ